jgi:hypothetical protein
MWKPPISNEICGFYTVYLSTILLNGKAMDYRNKQLISADTRATLPPTSNNTVGTNLSRIYRPGMGDFSCVPQDICDRLFYRLSVYDFGRFSFTNKMMYLMFYKAALKPIDPEELMVMVANYEASLGEYFLFSAKIIRMMSVRQDKPVTTEQELFYKVVEGQYIKDKFLVCTKNGQAYLKEKNVDRPLIKTKIANLPKSAVIA